MATTMILINTQKYCPSGRRVEEASSGQEDAGDVDRQSGAASGKKRTCKELTMLQQDHERAGIVFDMNSLDEDVNTTTRTRQKRRATSLEQPHHHADVHGQDHLSSAEGEQKKYS